MRSSSDSRPLRKTIAVFILGCFAIAPLLAPAIDGFAIKNVDRGHLPFRAGTGRPSPAQTSL